MFEQTQINSTGWTPGLYPFPWISEWRARGIIPLTAGLRLISGVVMQLPLRQYRGEAEVIPPATVVANPAPADNGTLATFVDGYVSDMALYGNHVSLIGEPDSTGWPSSILPLDVTKVSVVRQNSGRLAYTYAGEEPLDGSQLLHVALDKRSGEIIGRGLIPTMAAGLMGAQAAEEYAGRYFDESAIPTGVINDSRPDLTQDQADELKAAWLRTVGGRQRTPIVLPTSTTFTPLVSDADNAQLVQARQWNSQVVAMALGIPPFMLGIETQRHTYTNAENEFGRFIRTTVMRLLVPLEQQFSLQLLPRGNEANFDTRNLLRPEAAARFTMAISGFAAHLLTEGEARELMGYPADGGPGIGPSDASNVDETQTPVIIPAPLPLGTGTQTVGNAAPQAQATNKEPVG
jgi:HK97 family phage portal protein